MTGYGVQTLFVREVRRFMRVPGQTLAAPLVSTGLYLLVFGYALGNRLKMMHGVPYLEYITPGLVMLGVITNAFLNSTSSMIGMKFQGTLVDLLVTPLSHLEISVAMIGAAVVRGVLVGSLTWAVAVLAQGQLHVAHPLLALAFPILSGIGLGALGLLTGIWAEKFEQVNFVPTFLIMPLTFLGGVFYDVRELPEPFSTISHLNPILYLVEGMRFGLIGSSGVDPMIGLGFVSGLDALAVLACVLVLRSGWKLRV